MEILMLWARESVLDQSSGNRHYDLKIQLFFEEGKVGDNSLRK